jgi:hypothetical protein
MRMMLMYSYLLEIILVKIEREVVVSGKEIQE